MAPPRNLNLDEAKDNVGSNNEKGDDAIEDQELKDSTEETKEEPKSEIKEEEPGNEI